MCGSLGSEGPGALCCVHYASVSLCVRKGNPREPAKSGQAPRRPPPQPDSSGHPSEPPH